MKKIYFLFFKSEKNVQVQLMSFSYWRNNREMKKWIFFFNLKIFTRPANEFLLHKCRNKKNKINDFFFQIWKNLQVQLMNFCYINVETEILKNDFFSSWKNVQVQLMNSYYIIETIVKWKNGLFFSNMKKIYKSS